MRGGGGGVSEGVGSIGQRPVKTRNEPRLWAWRGWGSQSKHTYGRRCQTETCIHLHPFTHTHTHAHRYSHAGMCVFYAARSSCRRRQILEPRWQSCCRANWSTSKYMRQAAELCVAVYAYVCVCVCGRGEGLVYVRLGLLSDLFW